MHYGTSIYKDYKLIIISFSQIWHIRNSIQFSILNEYKNHMKQIILYILEYNQLNVTTRKH